jgi:hypothetical protein
MDYNGVRITDPAKHFDDAWLLVLQEQYRSAIRLCAAGEVLRERSLYTPGYESRFALLSKSKGMKN